MKKFLIFLVSIVVVVCFGLTTYYFMRNDEIIIVNTKEIFCNAGDIISLDSLKIEVKKPSRKTKYNYNAAKAEVTDLISYNEESGCYLVSETAGGEIELVISTTNKNYSEFKVKVHVGNGSVENPYYVFTQSDLAKIGSVYRLDSNYSLMNNIVLTNDFMPIGYSVASSSWVGFSGTFNGNGNTISNLNLNSSDYANAGFFSSINAGAYVNNLKLTNATINGSYANAGVLAGTIAGTVDRIAVTNSNITNAETNSYTGALTGVYNGSSLKLSYADNIAITVDNATNATVGGLVGKLIETTATATYANNVTINTASGVVGGYAGEFVIGSNTGSIQQSYANTTSAFADFAGFIGKVSANASFDVTKANMLTHFIGNIAVVASKANNAEITDTDLIKTFDNTYFKNDTYPGVNVFYNPAASLYLIRGYVSAGNVIETNEYVYYAIDSSNKTMWDTDYVWKINSISMPSLVLGSIEPNGVSGDYFRKDLEKIEITDNTNNFKDIFNTNVSDKKVQILDDVTLTDWTPVALTNCTIDGNGKTITLSLDNAKDKCLGLFSTLDNCTIENLNIVITGVSANATDAGALAGKITSSADTISTIKNVNITYENNFGTVTIANFGGVAGNIEKTEISNTTVKGLKVIANSNITNAGGVVANITSGTVKDSTIKATLYASTNVGGVVATNNGTISNIDATVVVGYNKAVANASVGGVVANNNGSVLDVNANVSIIVSNANSTLNVGGVSAINNGNITNTTLTGNGIAIGSTEAKVNGTIYVGGVAGVNNGEITSTYNYLANVGTYFVGANYRVAGVASVNNGSISKVLTTSNLYGNVVAGVVVEMNAISKTIDQVVVGNYNKKSATLTANEIKGDKYVAGVAVDFRAGLISNIQASSNLVGGSTDTRTSLIVLIFPNGAEIINSTINSKLSGYGTFYRDSWADFADYTNKAEFGFDSYGSNNVRFYYFNVYMSSVSCGKITSVVINSDYKTGDMDVQQGMAIVSNFIGFIPSSDTYNGVNNIKETSNFTDYAEFTGNFTFNYAYNSLYKSYRDTSATLTFEVGSVWEDGNGINLMFLKNA